MTDTKTLQEALYLTWMPRLVNKQKEKNNWILSRLKTRTKFRRICYSNHCTAPHRTTTKHAQPLVFRLGYDSNRSILITQTRDVYQTHRLCYLEQLALPIQTQEPSYKRLDNKSIQKITDVLHNEDQMIRLSSWERKSETPLSDCLNTTQ